MISNAGLPKRINPTLVLYAAFLLLPGLGALVPATLHAALTTNIDDRVVVEFTEVQKDKSSQLYDTWVKVTNISAASIQPPVRVAVTRTKHNKYSLANADGVTSEGAFYIDIDLPGAVLATGQSSALTLLSFDKGNSSNNDFKQKNWRHDKSPVRFDYVAIGGTAVAATAPVSSPFVLSAGSGNTNVVFRVRLLGVGVAPVNLRSLSAGGADSTMDDDGIFPDNVEGDGIYALSQAINTDDLAGGDCLTYVSATTDANGFELVSQPYKLCATTLPTVVATSNVAPENQLSIGGGVAVANEVLIVADGNVSEKEIIALVKSIGGTVSGTLLTSGLYQIQLPAGVSEAELEQLIDDLKKIDGVIDAGPNFIGSFTSTPSDIEYATQHALQLVSSDDLSAPTPRHVWDANANATGMTITLIDSGINAGHPDFDPARITAEISAGDNTDVLGHGTEMGGIIAAATHNAIGIAGVAREVTIESIRIADSAPTQAQMMAGFTTAASSGTGEVVNAAFSIFGPLLPINGLCGTINTLIGSGKVVVNSAGNDNNSTTGVWPGMCNDPALDPFLASSNNLIASDNKANFIVVGASSCTSGACASDGRWSGSNYGNNWVDISAPGVSLPTTTIAAVDATQYTSTTGTSASTALTSSAIAILRGCGVSSAQAFNTLNLGATIAVTGLPNRINIYSSLLSINTLPTALSLSNNAIDENTDASTGFSIGGLSTTDATVCDFHSYQITGGGDAASFSIGGTANNELVLTAAAVNFEVQASYDVIVESTDFYGQSTSQAYAINVADVDEAPVILPQARSIDENAANGTNVGTALAASDEDGGANVQFSINGGNSGGAFSINAANGQLSVANTNALNYESLNSFSLDIGVVDTSDAIVLPTSATVTVSVFDVDEAPLILPQLRSIDENSANGSNVGTPIVATDVDAGFSPAFAIIAGNSGGAFAINNSGQITVANSAALDFETTPVFNLNVQITDNGDSPPLSATAVVTVNLNDLVEGTVLPAPILVYSHFEDYTGSDDNPYRRWHFNVTNFNAYPLELFTITSDYGPCGLNPTPSRTWVNFYDAGTNAHIYGFCGFTDPSNLNLIWFARPAGDPPPAAGVYIRLEDRSTDPDTIYQSNVVPASELPVGP